MNYKDIDIAEAITIAASHDKKLETNFLVRIAGLFVDGELVGLAGLYRMSFIGHTYLGLIPFANFTARHAVSARKLLHDFLANGLAPIIVVDTQNKTNERFASWLGFTQTESRPGVFTWQK